MLVICHFQISKTNISLDVSETLVKRFTSKKDFHSFSEHQMSFYWKTTHVQSTYSKNISSCTCIVLINYYALVNELNSKSSVEENNFTVLMVFFCLCCGVKNSFFQEKLSLLFVF